MKQLVIKCIEHANTQEKNRIVSLLHLMSVYEPDGSLQHLLRTDYNWIQRNGFTYSRYNIVTAHLNGALVGYCFYYPESKQIEIYVLPHKRKGGIGKALIEGVRTWSGNSALSAWRGFDGYKHFFDANFIVCLDDFSTISREDYSRHGCGHKAYTHNLKEARQKASRAYRQYKKQSTAA